MSFKGKVILRKRAIIESVNDVQKNTYQIEHYRHRSFDNSISNMITRLIAYRLSLIPFYLKTHNMLPNKSVI
jgi:hypothetical protein